MARIKPFTAIRPAKDKVPFVASRSYEDYSNLEREAILRYNPFSFLHIVNPGYRYHKEISGSERFGLVRNRYLEFLEAGILVRDPEPALYVYAMEKEGFSCTGIFCATDSADYAQNRIKKHENTIASREQLFASYLDHVGFNVEPVLMTYPDDDRVSVLIEGITRQHPDLFFTSPDRVSHRLWQVNDSETVSELVTAFDDIPHLYIADGHHRSASSLLLTEGKKAKNPKHTGDEPYNFFMSYLIPESQVRISGFSRLVKDLNGWDKEGLLFKLDSLFMIDNRGSEPYLPALKHHFSMYLDGDFYSLVLRNTAYDNNDPLESLDAHILYNKVLRPLLGLEDLRNDDRIDYDYSPHAAIQMKSKVDQGGYAIGFHLRAVQMEELKRIADNDLVMPPKSTYIEPKLRSGLTIYEF